MASQECSNEVGKESTKDKGKTIMESESMAPKSSSVSQLNSSSESKPEFNVLNATDSGSSSKEGNGETKPQEKKAHICKTCKKEFPSGPALGGHRHVHNEGLGKSKPRHGRNQDKDEGMSARFRFHPYPEQSYNRAPLRVQTRPQFNNPSSNHSIASGLQRPGHGRGWPTANVLGQPQSRPAIGFPVHSGPSELGISYPMVAGNGSYRSPRRVQMESIIHNPPSHRYTLPLLSTPPPQPCIGNFPALNAPFDIGSLYPYGDGTGASTASTPNAEMRRPQRKDILGRENPPMDDDEDASGLDLSLRL